MEEELKMLIIWLCQTRPKSAVKLLVFTGGQSRKGFDGKTFLRYQEQGFELPEIQDEVHPKGSPGVKTNSPEPR